jgi:hypothetical protein
MNAGFGLGLFYAMGQRGSFATSPDGVEWTPRTLPHTGFIWDLAAGGKYVAAAAQWGRILTSENGIDWVRRETELSWHFTDIAFGNGTFIAVGWDGQIAQSDPIEVTTPIPYVQITDARRSGSQFSFKFNGEVGRSYEVQISTDLNQWQPLTSVNCTEPLTSFSDPASAGARFYRVKAH